MVKARALFKAIWREFLESPYYASDMF